MTPSKILKEKNAVAALQNLTTDTNPFNSPACCPFMSRDWDIDPSKLLCERRLRLDIKDIMEEKLHNIFFEPDEKDITRSHAMIVGNDDTPYEGGLFHFYMRVPTNYPLVCPRVCSMTSYRFGESVRFNPNLYKNGLLCLSILGTWEGPSWSAALSFRSVLQSVQSTIFVKEALKNEPYQSWSVKEILNYDIFVRHETIRVAVIHTLKHYKKCDIKFKVEMQENFMKYYPSYIASCNELEEYDHKTLSNYFEATFSPTFKKLKEELEKLYDEMKSVGNLDRLQVE